MNALNISKIGLYGMFLNYYCYYLIKGSFIPRGTVLFLGLMILGVAADIASRNWDVYVSIYSKLWLCYGFVAFATTLIFYGNEATGLMSDITKYFQRILIIMIIAYICEQENRVTFAVNLMAVTAVGCMIAVFMTMSDYRSKLNLTSGANISTNDVGSIMAYGCFAILFVSFSIFNNVAGDALKAAAIVAFVSVIFMAGSRKSIIAILIFFVLWILLCGLDFLQNQSAGRKIILLLIGILVFWFVSKYLLSYALDTNLYDRVLGDKAESAASSDDGRIEFYRMAMQDFFDHILVGDGYNMFVTLHGNYSHSTYAEPLADSGIWGFLYLLPYFLFVIRQWTLIGITKYDQQECVWQKNLLAFLIAFLFIGIGIPYIYKDIPCIILGMFAASQTITKLKYGRDELT